MSRAYRSSRPILLANDSNFCARLSLLCERLAGHLSVRREGHFEFNATECGSGEGLAVEECRLDVAWSHGLRSEGCARVEKYCRNKEWFCAHRTSGGWPTLTPCPARTSDGRVVQALLYSPVCLFRTIGVALWTVGQPPGYQAALQP